MISPISSNNLAALQGPQTNTAVRPAKAPANPPQDHVQLSPQATGDIDHDGDSR